MRAITIHQPWASLLAHKVKRYETRSWACPSDYLTGPGELLKRVAIHASLTQEALWDNGRYAEMGYSGTWREMFLDHSISLDMSTVEGTLGGILGVTAIDRCYHIVSVEPSEYDPDTCSFYGRFKDEDGYLHTQLINISTLEYDLGDWTPGRYAWRMADVRLLPQPIPCRGGDKFWAVPTPIEAQIKYLLEK